MKKLFKSILLSACLIFCLANIAKAQLILMTSPGDNRKALVMERIGVTDVNINYSRPGVKKREGHIWGEVVHKGYAWLFYGSSKEAPWRAGANENTTFEFTTDVSINGQLLPAGKYGFFVAYDPNECTLIFSKNSDSWGSFFYKPEEDALRVKVKPLAADKSVEWLKYEFTDETETSASVQLQWEKLIIPFKIDVDLVKTQIASFRKQLPLFASDYNVWVQAAQFCHKYKTNLNEALLWTDTATSAIFSGNKSFKSWSVKAAILRDLGRDEEADAAIKNGLAIADNDERHRYGRQLLGEKKTKQAFDLFKINYDREPDKFMSNWDMTKAYSALGEYKKALPFAKKALTYLKEKDDIDFMTKVVKNLQDGKNIN